MPLTITVSTTADSGTGSLRDAITLANTAPGSTIQFALPTNSTILLSSALPLITADMTIDGAGATGLAISGNNAVRVFFVASGNVTIENLDIIDGYAKGGDGGDPGGGGGLGAGGAIFVNAGTTTIANVDFIDNAAKGGDGGAGGTNNSGGGGGSPLGDGQNGTSLGGGAGGGTNGGAGGYIGGDGGDFGGGGGGDLIIGGRGGFGGGPSPGDGGDGGFGGGGGSAGAKGWAGGDGDYGGGGGGGADAGFLAGQGGYLAGSGGGGDPVAGTTGSGGGGAAFGGAVFLRAGASLIIKDGSFTGSSVTAGAAGGPDSGAGFAWVSDLFLMDGTVVTLAPEAGKTLVFNGLIRDSGGEGPIPPSFLAAAGAGATANIGDGTSTGTVQMGVPGATGFFDTPGVFTMDFKSGTLHLVGLTSSANLIFEAGSQTLELDSDAFYSGTNAQPDLQLKSFGAGDVIHLPELVYVAGATASWASNAMAVTSGGITYTLTMVTPEATMFVARDDGTPSHGTIVYLVAPTPSISGLTSATDSGTVGDDHTVNTMPAISGTGAGAGDTITVYLDGSQTAAGATTAAGDGSWTFSFTSALSTGAHSVTVTDAAGGLTSDPSSAYALTIDAVPQAPVITGISDDTGTSSSDGITTDGQIFVNGTGTDGDTIHVELVGFATTTTATVSGGTWSADFTGIILIGGTYHFEATQTDAFGNVSTVSSTYDVLVDRTAPALTITSDKPTLGIGDTATITFAFTDDPDTSFTAGDIAVSGGSLGPLSGTGLTRTAVFTPSPNADGASITIDVAAGSYTDKAGNNGGTGASPSITFHNEAPTDIALSHANVAGHSPNGTVIGTLSDTDPDAGDSATYTLTDDAGGRFAISGDKLVVANGALLDSGTTSSVTVHVTDASGLGFSKDFAISVDAVTPYNWAGSGDLGAHGGGYQVVGLGDFDGDGTADVLWQNPAGQLDEWRLQDGNWSASVDLGSHGAGWHVAGIGDFNGDGTSDVLWRETATGKLDAWTMQDGQWAKSTDLGSHGADWTVLGVGDFDGNGTDDILFQNTATGAVDEWVMANGNWSRSISLGSHSTAYSSAAIGDFDGDGTDDVLWHNPTTGAVEQWHMQDGNWAGSLDLGVHNSAYALAAVNDFNGDGTSDVLWHDAASGHVDGWVMDNGQWFASVSLGAFDPAYALVGTGDLNQAGGADVLWHNATTGQVGTWLLQAV
jgi:hypothetical protein